MNASILGIDLGGTNVRAGVVHATANVVVHSEKIRSDGSVEDVLTDIFSLTDTLIDDSVSAIGIGVPSVVDAEKGIVYDVVNIPSWKEVPLKTLLEKRYGRPVLVNNDANCFALGEHYFGKGKGHPNWIGLTIGTGLGSGIILNNKLYCGANCGAGEFGMVDYRDKFVEYYASGQFFQNVYGVDGPTAFERAKNGDPVSIEMYREFGTHLGNAVKAVLYTYDVPLIIFGGSVRNAAALFWETMWEQIRTFAFTKTVQNLRIEISELANSGVFGAAALHYNKR